MSIVGRTYAQRSVMWDIFDEYNKTIEYFSNKYKVVKHYDNSEKSDSEIIGEILYRVYNSKKDIIWIYLKKGLNKEYLSIETEPEYISSVPKPIPGFFEITERGSGRNSLKLCFRYFAEIKNSLELITNAIDVYFGETNSVAGNLPKTNASRIVEEVIVKKVTHQFDHNTILYGPPGTGKTYNSKTYAVAICDDKSIEELTDYGAVQERYDQLVREGRIQFTTFHQSYGYEEFIEGIKPMVKENSTNVSYSIESGVFKKFCEKASVIQANDVEDTGKVWTVRNRTGSKDGPDDFETTLYEKGVIKTEEINHSTCQSGLLNDMMRGDWIVLGRNYDINAIGVIIDDEPEKIDDGIFKYQRQVKWLIKGLKEDCRAINAGKCISNFAIANSRMKIQDLQQFTCLKAINDKNYVFIIDEINRGNISKIFGELITLIEDTKRAGMPEESRAVLPYSGEWFSVPSNVYLLGTMNTADRSIAMLDTALRRRFSFIEMPARPELLDDVEVVDGGVAVNIGNMLRTINKRIAHLYDREHTIGHAPFMKLIDDPSIERLADIFRRSVVPLLQEYFYEDYSKIRAVLGDNAKADSQDQFVTDNVLMWDDDFLGNQSDEISIPEHTYEIKYENFNNIRCYKGIIDRL